MDESWTSYFLDLEQYDCSFINQGDVDRNMDGSLSNSSVGESSLERPSKHLKTANSEHLLLQKPAASSSPSLYVLSFDSVNPQPTNCTTQLYGHVDSAMKPKDKAAVNNFSSSGLSSKGSLEKPEQESSKKANSVTRNPHAHGHIIAERMRREKITQQFIALSALIPGLKKIDKASVLGDAIKYVKQLQEHVKLLEEQTKRRSVESVVFVKKSQLSADDVSDTSSNSFDENSDSRSKSEGSLPEVEARVSEKDVLIRVHCQKRKGVPMKILREIENLNLSVVNSSVLPFGTSILDITIVAQMEDEFKLTVKELARNLRVALMPFM